MLGQKFSGTPVARMGKGAQPHPLNEVALNLRYMKDMVLVDVAGNGVELVYAPFLRYEAPELEGQRVFARKDNPGSLEKQI
jgi:hypothetical protein